MKRIFFAFLLVLIFDFSFSWSQEEEPADQTQTRPPDVRFHYALVGSMNGIDVEISIDSFVLPWLGELVRESDNTEPDRHKAIENEIVQRLKAETKIFYFAAVVTNRTDQNIELSVFTDNLTLSNGDVQQDFRPDPESISTYPSRLLRHSRTTISFPRSSPDDRIRAMNAAAWWSGKDEGLLLWVRRIHWARPAESGEQLKERVRIGLKSAAKKDAESLFGELVLGSAGVDVPLALNVSLADDGMESETGE